MVLRCFPEQGFESVTLTCVNNGAKPGGRAVDVAKLQKLVKDQGFLIDGGYGKIKGKTFRISNMGDETEATMNQLYAAMDKAMRTNLSCATGKSRRKSVTDVGARSNLLYATAAIAPLGESCRDRPQLEIHPGAPRYSGRHLRHRVPLYPVARPH